MAVSDYALAAYALYDARKGVQTARTTLRITSISGGVDAIFYTGTVPHGLTAAETAVIATANTAVSVDGTKTIGTIDSTTTFRLNPAFDNSASLVLASAVTATSPGVVTKTAHGLVTGRQIVVTGSTTTPTLDGLRTVVVLDANTFHVSVNVSVLGTIDYTANFGTVTATGNTPAVDAKVVTKWSGQLSGKDLVQANATNAPSFHAGNRPGLAPGVMFSPNINDTGTPENMGHPQGGGGIQKLATGAGISATGFPNMRSLSFLAVISQFNPLDGTSQAAPATAEYFGLLLSLSVGDYRGVGIWRNRLCLYSQTGRATSFLPNADANPLTIVDSGIYISHTPIVIACSCGPVNTRFRVRNQAVTLPGIDGVPGGSKAFEIANIGTTYIWTGKMHLMGVSGSIWTDAQLDDMVDYAQSDWGISPTVRLSMRYLGDSITSGNYPSGLGGAMTWAHYLDCMISRGGCGHDSLNLGFAGKTTTQILADYTARVHPTIRTDIQTIGVVMAGINNIPASTAAQVAADLLEICDNLRESGCRKVVLCGILPGVTAAGVSGGGGEDAAEAIRLDVNTTIAAGYPGHADYYVPLDFLCAPTIDYATMKLRLHGDKSIMVDQVTNWVHPQATLQQQIAREIYKVIANEISVSDGVAAYGSSGDIAGSRFFR